MIMMGDKKKMLGAILGPEETEEAEAPNELHAIAQEAISAIHSNDAAGFADALRAAFDLCDSEPHEEGPHEG